MKKNASIIYTVFIMVVLLAVVAYFGWQTYQTRTERISSFTERTNEYTHRLAAALKDNRDIDFEVAIAETIMADDPTIVAIQVYSQDDGLRLSVVKPITEEFSSRPLVESDYFNSLVSRIRYHVVNQSLGIPAMQDLEAYFVSATLSGADIRGNLLIILVTVSGLFLITLFLIFARPPRRTYRDDNHYEESLDDPYKDQQKNIVLPDELDEQIPEDEELNLPDFDETDRLDETDLLNGNPDFEETLPMEDDFQLPDLDDDPFIPTVAHEEILTRLESELEQTASVNQDLALLLFTLGGQPEETIRSAYTNKDLVFSLDNDTVAVIETNTSVDESLAITEDFLRQHIKMSGSRDMRVGIASQNGRLISAERLFNEAENALRKADKAKNIVAFRSDPEKYRQYLKNQQG